MIVELSHPIVEGMVTYPGVPGPVLGTHLSREDSREVYAPGTEFHIGTITLAANTGTYLDTPHHRYDGGPDLSQVPLSSLADLPGIVVRAAGATDREIRLDPDLDVRGKAVLVHTGWDRYFGTDAYFHGHPYLAPESARRLAERGAALVGIDSLNMDDTPPRGERPAHTVLLAAGIPLVEHLTGLAALPDEGFRFHAAPPMVAGMGTFPVRAYAVVP
ncbi:cyclase family protein [Nonomuraea roseoviolacea]|uniref:Kynurenine formamidase n=1 Tax=Nonomuraea roseoviolacea subsp. carminata TaxID=160689 RepID=A0ABT1JTC6_9ACTN|nr:cyclase family protein [Nonomuraea roseoviolacea]MCP2344589.1 kynurenine formamidase [Nonomuraea roseoviolacea subsp. carminata]